MISTDSLLGSLSLRPLAFRATLALGVALTTVAPLEAAMINARSATLVDVAAAITLAKDGDAVILPVGTATWTSTLTITKNIILQGAGEAQTVITENLPRTTQPPLISVNLSHDAPASQAYSFRLTGFTFKSAAGLGYYGSSDNALIKITGNSSYVNTPTATNPAPYVLGCVSRVRVDHCTFYQLKATHFIPDSVLGVMDHCSFNAIGGYPIKCFNNNWTPSVYKGTTMTRLARKGFGSWADDPYWGTDKFWFFEDCDFYTDPNNSFNVMDNEEACRVVVRHNTFRGGNGGVASHGMEGRSNPGIKQIEFYNNYLNINRLFAQHRSGSALYFNNLSTNCSAGMDLQIYRLTRTEPNWGHASGNNRYDSNANNGAIVVAGVADSGTISTMTDANPTTGSFSNINLSDGANYSIIDKNVLESKTAGYTDPAWQYKGAAVVGINGNTLHLFSEAGNSPVWAAGHAYEIRKVNAVYGQPGQGKGNLLNPDATANSYVTYTYPATSGAKATYPMVGYPLEPCYSWNNTDLAHGQLGFTDIGMKSLKPDRDYYNKGEITPLTTQSVGFPAQNYARATTNYPKIGPGGIVPYTPYTYPHPLVTGAAKATSPPSPPTNLQIVPGG